MGEAGVPAATVGGGTEAGAAVGGTVALEGSPGRGEPGSVAVVRWSDALVAAVTVAVTVAVGMLAVVVAVVLASV